MVQSLSDLLVASANQALSLQQADGSFPPGHNGPWDNIDTPVRCTSHWLILLKHVHGLTGDSRLRDGAGRAFSYLMSAPARPKQAAFHCCVSDDPFMAANGLIGQAWTMEALLEYGEIERPLQVARQHRFDQELGLWHMLGLGGEIGERHRTLNQQIWFAVMVLRLAQADHDRTLEAQALRFFECLPRLICMDGHCIDMRIRERAMFGNAWGRYLGQQLRKLRHPIYEYQEVRFVHELTLGYLGFTLYGLALLHQWNPHLPLWQDATWRRALVSSMAYADEQLFTLPLEKNRYAFSYNPLGIEMALVKQSFGDLARGTRSAEDWLGRQMRDHFDHDKGLMTRNTGDANILAARIYQACRLTEMPGGTSS